MSKSGRPKVTVRKVPVFVRLEPRIAKYIVEKAKNERVSQAKVIETCVMIGGRSLKFKINRTALHTPPPPRNKRATFAAV